MGHYKSNLRDIEFNLFEVLGRDRTSSARARSRTSTSTPRASILARDRPAGRATSSPTSFADADRNPPVFDPATHTRDAARVVQEVATRPAWTASGGGSDLPAELGGTRRPAVAALGARRAGPRRQPGRLRCTPPARPSPASSTATAPTEQKKLAQLIVDKRLGRHDGAHRARRRLRRRRRPHQGRPAATTAPGTSRASSASSPRPSTTWPRTSSTSCWPAPRAPARAPRACRCSSCRSSTSTSRPASSASATASTSPTSSTRWASRSPPPAS